MLWKKTETHKGRISQESLSDYQLLLPATKLKYSNAQIDDYSGKKRRNYLWGPNTHLSLEACFSHNQEKLRGTAGFGFWNAPFGDPNQRYPVLPKAVWFFFGSAPTDLPLHPTDQGQGWFANTIDTTTWQALQLAPLAPITLILNHWPWFRLNIWPTIQNRLAIDYKQIPNIDMKKWHTYQIIWRKNECEFRVDNQVILKTASKVTGPLGFVCWLDNQYMIVTPTGKMKSGTISTHEKQWLKIRNISVKKLV